MKYHVEEVIIELELPGYSKTDIIVVIENQHLIVKANKDHSAKQKGDHFYHEESAKNSFEYKTALPPVNSKEMRWHLTDGILTIKIPKRNKNDIFIKKD